MLRSNSAHIVKKTFGLFHGVNPADFELRPPLWRIPIIFNYLINQTLTRVKLE